MVRKNCINNKQSKILAAAAALILAGGLICAPVTADTFTYTPVNGGSFQFAKYLVIDKDVAVPDTECTFSIGDMPPSSSTINVVIEDKQNRPGGDITIPVESSSCLSWSNAPSDVDVEDAKPGILWEDEEETTGTPGTRRAPEEDTTSGNTMPVYKQSEGGIEEGVYPTIEYGTDPNACVFTSQDQTYPEDGLGLPAGLTAIPTDINFKTPDNKTDEVYARQIVTVNFSNVSFKKPGIYRYYIAENTISSSGITPDNKLRTLDVYITDDGSGNLKVSSYVLHTSDKVETVANDGDPVSDKCTGFTNQYDPEKLSFAVKVGGNQESKDKYFAVTVKLEATDQKSIKDDDVFAVANQNTDRFRNVTDEEQLKKTPNNATSYTVGTMKQTMNQTDTSKQVGGNDIDSLTGAQLKAGYTFYLKSDQYVTIYGSLKDLHYTVTENAEGYESAPADTKTITLGTSNAPDTFTNAVTGTFGENDVRTGFTNSKEGTIPTGIITVILPYAIGVFAAAAVILFAVIRMNIREKGGVSD
ncbi:MAG: FctA domain-containing protein [Eubacterium sp.]|nr:FctA domain-containing protein [Eubacterium sp.]